MSAVRSVKAKDRWKQCESIAAVLGITKHLVHDFLWNEMTPELRQVLCLGIAPTADLDAVVSEVKGLPGWERMQNRPKVFHPRSDGDLAETPEDQLRIAMWFIRKIGDVERAKAALDIAASAVLKLTRKQ